MSWNLFEKAEAAFTKRSNSESIVGVRNKKSMYDARYDFGSLVTATG